MTRIGRLLALASAMVAIVAIAAPASAGKAVPSNVSLKTGNVQQPPLFGWVTSDDRRCVGGRTVLVFVNAPRRGFLGKADHPSSAKGKWAFGSELQGGTTFHAKVKALKKKGVRCGAAVSEELELVG
jgi:hypothetical protein